MSIVLAAALVVALAAGAGGGAGLAGSGAATGPAAGAGSFEEPAFQAEIDADGTVLRANVEESGDAVWIVEYRLRLTDDEREQAFVDLESDIESDPAPYRDRFRDRMERTAADASEATGREMAVGNVSVDTRLEGLGEPPVGVVRYRFRWTNFARATDGGDRIEIGDAIAGFVLAENNRLTVAWPEDYEAETVRPEPGPDGGVDERRVSWVGERDFGSGGPRVVVTRGGGLPVPGAGAAGVAVALAAAALAAAALVVRRRDGGAAGAETAAVAEAGTGAETGPDGEGGRAEGDGAAGAAEAAADDGPPEELLSNEERIVRLLRGNGGRMKQQDVVEALGWTEARTSQVVTDLRDEGEIESFRLGRENVLRLPEVDDEELP